MLKRQFPDKITLKGKHIFATGLIALYAIILARTAWIYEDAYITMRTVSNFVNGYGLTWNAVERVQAYTHPLWMFLLSLFHVFTHEVFLTTIIVSIILSVTGMIVYTIAFWNRSTAIIIGILILISSKFFVDFSTSGFANPLTHLLVILFGVVYFRGGPNSRSLFYLSLITAMSILNRMDIIVLLTPALAYYFWQLKSLRAVVPVLAGFSPFFFWELFSVWYYGSFVANTAYAKITTGIPRSEYFVQGAHYLEAAFRGDYLMVAVLVFTIGLTIWRRGKSGWPVACGIIGYIFYVVWIGGCFIGGRFLTAPFIMSVVLLSQHDRIYEGYRKYVFVAIIITLGLSIPGTSVLSGRDYGSGEMKGLGYHIENARLRVFQSASLWNREGFHSESRHNWAEEGKRCRVDSDSVFIYGYIGYVGYYCGPEKYIVDVFGLANPLLARLPAVKIKDWKPGHFERAIPDGYIETLETGRNCLEDPWLATYYDSLSYAIRGPLWSGKRTMAAIKLAMGGYDYLLERAEPVIYSVAASHITESLPVGTQWWNPSVTIIPDDGLIIKFDTIIHEQRFEVSLDNNDDYKVQFLKQKQNLGEIIIKSTGGSSPGLANYSIDLPRQLYEPGYDAIYFMPISGDHTRALGHLKLVGYDYDAIDSRSPRRVRK